MNNFKLLDKTKSRAGLSITLVTPKMPTVKKTTDAEQDMMIILATKDGADVWTYRQLIHKGGIFEWYENNFIVTEELQEWCEENLY